MSPPSKERRLVYGLEQRQQFADLIRQHGARATRELSMRTISLKTLLTIAKEFGIELKKGKRRKRAA